MIYPAASKGPFKISGYYDPQSKRIMGIVYKPPTWTPNTVYYQQDADNYDIVIPTVFKGFYFKVDNPGLSGAVEPIWPTVVGGIVTDNAGLVWEAVAYNLMPPSVSILTSTFTVSDGVSLSGAASTAGTTQVTIVNVPAGVTNFTLLNHTVKSNGEEDDVSLFFRVADR